MPKIRKEKFNVYGEVKGQTTFRGAYEFDLYYAGKDLHFYFEPADIIKELPELKDKLSYGMFHKCDTRNKAVNIVESLIKEYFPMTKALYVTLGVGVQSILSYDGVRSKQVMPYVQTQEVRYKNGSSAIGLAVDRYYVMDSDDVENRVMIAADKNWRKGTNHTFRKYLKDGFLIDWTQEREDYLLSMADTIDKVGINLLKFFNEGVENNSGSVQDFLDNAAKEQIFKLNQ